MAGPSALLVVSALAFGSDQASAQPSSAALPIAIDVVAVPSSPLLTPAEVTVTVDGRPRKVIWVRPIFRGPGSERMAAEAAPASQAPIAEPGRTIIVALDETTLARGSEKKISSAIARVLDLIGPPDRAAVIPLPASRDASFALTGDKRVLWSALGKIRVGSSAAPLALARAEEGPRLSDDETQIRSPSTEERPAGERDPKLASGTVPRQETAERKPGILQELRGLLTGVQKMPGPKTLVIVRGTAPADPESRQEAGTERLESVGLLQLTAAARVTVHAITLGDKWRGGGDELGRLARLTGGDEFRLGKQADAEVARLGTWMAEGVRIAIEGLPDDVDARPRQVVITTTRPGLAVRTPERWLPFEAHEPEPRAAVAPPGSTTPSAIVAPTPAPRAVAVARPDPELQRVLARTSSYVAQYIDDFSAVVAEEAYEQKVTSQLPRRMAGPTVRKLRSDFLLVRIPGADEWMPFRDVFEVNGEPIRDRDDRLRKLFIEMPPDAFDKARKILDEGARYNLGSMYHNVNLPVLPLVFLMPRYIGGFQFKRAGEDNVEGVRAWRIDFEETGRPTVIKNDKEHRDIPATGTLWVDPITGRIVKTRVRILDISLKMDTTVVYRRSDTLQLWAPAEMEELYISSAERLTGSARYKNFRRFRVDVEEKIAVPKS